MDNFTTSTINLSFKYAETDADRQAYSRNPITDPTDPRFGQTYATANVYTIPGVNGGRPVSIMALVMALCMSRAIELESRIIEKMSEMEANSDLLEFLTECQESILAGGDFSSWSISRTGSWGYISLNYSSKDEAIKDLDHRMDSLNSFSQQTMIDLQSLTNKRDQSYDMASNIIKSLYTTLVGISNNM